MLKRVREQIDSIPLKFWVAGLILLCLPAFLINLGLFAFTGDEAIRSLVALEMKLSGNFIATTMHGADYINKPPLFNWFILIFSEIWGSYGEWPARLTTVAFLGLFAWAHYRFLKPHFGTEAAVLGGFMLITSGRFLFYDAMLGLIDTAFSCTIYALFMTLYYYGSKQKWGLMFLISYLLMALGFLLKGFPAIVFQGFSVLAAVFFWKKPSLLIKRSHILGGLAGLAVLVCYLVALGQYRDLEVFLSNLLNESTKRTVIAYDWGRFFRHLYEFPFDSIYHFLPWSLMAIFWLDRNFWKRLRENDFARFNFILLMVNLPVYWTSVQVMPRYLLMFIPLYNCVGIYMMGIHRSKKTIQYKIFYIVFGILLTAGMLAAPALPFVEAVAYLKGINWIAGGLFLTMLLSVLGYFLIPKQSLWFFLAGLLFIRIAFDLVVLPARNDESIVTRARADVRKLASKYSDKNWYVYGDAYIREPASFYFTQYFNKIIPRTWDTSHPNSIYLVSAQEYPDFEGVCLDTLQTDYPELQILLFEKK